MAFYDSTNGPGGSVTTGWKVTNTPCDWYGVGCERGHVTYLGFAPNLLNGSIPTRARQSGWAFGALAVLQSAERGDPIAVGQADDL